MCSGPSQLARSELPQLDDSLDSQGEQAKGWGFPDSRPAVVSFMDLMIAALEAVMIQRELRRLQAGIGDARLRQAV